VSGWDAKGGQYPRNAAREGARAQNEERDAAIACVFILHFVDGDRNGVTARDGLSDVPQLAQGWSSHILGLFGRAPCIGGAGTGVGGAAFSSSARLLMFSPKNSSFPLIQLSRSGWARKPLVQLQLLTGAFSSLFLSQPGPRVQASGV
jgi:hypothetical protein